MIKLSRAELKKLSALCERRSYDIRFFIENEAKTDMEKALAQNEREWMAALSMKLSEIMLSDAKRIEITH